MSSAMAPSSGTSWSTAASTPLLGSWEKIANNIEAIPTRALTTKARVIIAELLDRGVDPDQICRAMNVSDLTKAFALADRLDGLR